MQRDRKSIAGIIIGLIMIIVMTFANQLGLDNNIVWGTRRYILFLLGVFIFSLSLLYRRDNFMGQLFHTETGRFRLSIGILSGAIVLGYIWLVSLGLWTTWPPSTNYYDQLASAFSHGQLALELQPDPALLALENPYEPANRKNIPVLWDATFFEGKYYLYWGPAPALIMAAVKLFYKNEIGDDVLTFIFTTGIFIFLTLTILELWKTYFSTLSQKLILASIALAGLINPLPFILIESRIYEAAIAGGQFFFIGGLYFLFSAFNKPNLLRLMLAGTLFTFAVGSRTILALPIGFISLIVLVWVFKTYRENFISFLSVFSTPLVIGAIFYAWYNFARFGSITEFGFNYVLTGLDLTTNIKNSYSLAYIPPNLFKTLFNPFEWKDTFPFIKPAIWGGPSSWLVSYTPKIYFYLAEGITGLFIGSPIFLFAFLRKRKELFWISISLTGSVLLLFCVTQIFFYTTMRYLLDLIPALTLLALLGAWSGFDSLRNKKVFSILATTLWAYTILIGILLPLSSNIKRFKEFNPELFQQLTNLFK